MGNRQEKHPNRPRVAELLDGSHKFIIPSYQRGYRWDSKQVTDLLNDLRTFAKQSDVSNYYLQPLVVRKKSITSRNQDEMEKRDINYEVLDGQQRLTTVLLILNYIINSPKIGTIIDLENLYSIDYDQRNTKINNPTDDDADGFYIKEANKVIKTWFDELINTKQSKTIDNIKNVLISLPETDDEESDEPTRSVRFIWYDLDENEQRDSDENRNETALKDIQAFNRLNAGKIGLTSAELIKALFIIDAECRPNGEIEAEQLASQWDEIERHFEDDEFWYFIKPTGSFYQTRIDLLFDFMTNKPDFEDKDYSYRRFQALFDKINKLNVNQEEYKMWEQFYTSDSKSNVGNMSRAWEEVKNCFDTLYKWYADNDYFHLIGYLVQVGMNLLEIKKKLDSESKGTHQDDVALLKNIIRERLFGKASDSEIEMTILQWNYENSGDKTKIRQALLLHNVETSRRSINSRFSFNHFSTQDWDIEHIDSQSGTTLQKPEEQLNWLRNAFLLLKKEATGIAEGSEREKNIKIEIAKEIAKFIYLKTHDENGNIIRDKDAKDVTNPFQQFFSRVNKMLSADNNDVDTQAIGNLCLLSAEINRSYKDAPFPIKRDRILTEDKAGAFIPICTRNLFLKYYTDPSSIASTLQAARWTGKDQSSYQADIIETLKSF